MKRRIIINNPLVLCFVLEYVVYSQIFIEHLPCVSSALEAVDTAEYETDTNPCPHKAYLLVGEIDNKIRK